MKLLPKLALTMAALGGLTLDALAGAGGAPDAGSLLLFPIYDNTRGALTILTVTNSNANMTPVAGGLLAGTVDVEFVYIDHYQCQEFNRTRRLTPNDTITVSAYSDNPNSRKGYVYVFAKSPTTGAAITWNHLLGIARWYGDSGEQDYDINPWVFKGMGAERAATDANNDGLRQLNGVEYEQSPNKLLVPRFFGQGSGLALGSNDATSCLVLINLTGAARFTALVDFLVYNDNEEVFSAQYDFRCWKKVELLDISGVFSNTFLLTTNHNVSETILGHETGWFRMDGNLAFSTSDSENDPAILSILIETLIDGVGAELPWVFGTQSNGELVSHSVFHP